MAAYVVVSKALRGSYGLSLSYNKLVYRTLCSYVKYFGIQSSTDPHKPLFVLLGM